MRQRSATDIQTKSKRKRSSEQKLFLEAVDESQFSSPESVTRNKITPREKFRFVTLIKNNRHPTGNKQRDKAKAKSGVPAQSRLLPGPWQLNTAMVFPYVLATAALYAGDLHLGFFRID